MIKSQIWKALFKPSYPNSCSVQESNLKASLKDACSASA